MTQQEKDLRTKRMEQITEVALKLFAYHGYHSTSISKIAKEAGMSKGLMYNYFSSKEELLKTLIIGFFDESERLLQEVIQPDLAPKEMIAAIAHGLSDQVKASFDHWKLFMALSFQTGVLDDFKTEIERKAMDFFQAITALFQEMGIDNPMIEAMLFGSQLDGIFMHYLQAGDVYPIDEVIEGFIQKYTR